MAKRKKPVDPKVADRRAARKAAQAARAAGADPTTHRPFEGLPSEADWVALREVVPAATATARTNAEHGGIDVQVVTLLPRLWPALKREDGVVLVALQTASSSGDPSRDVAKALLEALDADPGTALEHFELPGADAPRLQDVLDLDQPFDVTVHEDFAYTVGPQESSEAEVQQALAEAAKDLVPTIKVAGLEAAYWCRMAGKEFVRWARTDDPETLLDALARLHADRRSSIEDGARFVGAFRSCGILVPVWELVRGTEADDLAGPLAAFAPVLEEAIADTSDLTPEQRRARAGLVSRQVSLR